MPLASHYQAPRKVPAKPVRKAPPPAAAKPRAKAPAPVQRKPVAKAPTKAWPARKIARGYV